MASAQFRSTVFDLAVENGRLWAATGYGLTLYDISAGPPLTLDSIALAGTTRTVRVANGIAYAASGSAVQAVRWTGRELQLAGTAEAGAAINDLAVANNYLYAATTSGIVQFDLLNPLAPAKTAATFATSGTNVTSLALGTSRLFAVDGDASVEVFDIALGSAPRHLGAFASLLARPKSVRVVNGRIFVSDGVQTDILLGNDPDAASVSTAPFSFGSSSLAAPNSSFAFVAGNDLRLRALDVGVLATPVEVFRAELAPTLGTVNGVNALAITVDGYLYAGAGDIGLVTYDFRQFDSPYPLRNHTTVPTSSVAASASSVWFARAAGLVEYTISPFGGALTESKSWDLGHVSTVQDFSDFLLTSSGNTATLWTVVLSSPIAVGTTTFPSPVRRAVLTGTTGYFLLDDKTLWTANLTDTAVTPKKIAIDLAPQFIARFGSNIAVAELRNDGTTNVALLKLGPTTTIASSVSVPGLATAGLALSNTTAAVWTFRGITLIDLASGTTSVLPQSNSVAAKQLAMYDTTLVEMTDSALLVWNTATKQLTAQYTLPSPPVALTISGNGKYADLATVDGVASILLSPKARMPSLIPASNGNFYAKKLAASANRLVLFDGRNAEVFTTSLEFRGAIRNALDVAANDANVFTLTNAPGVAMFTRDGQPLGSALITEGSNVQPLSLAAINGGAAGAAGAAWASIVRGCPLNCEKVTIVFDARGATPLQTATMTGAVRDVAVSGTRAFVLTELPDEIRVLDVSDPAHPRQLAARASEGTRLPMSIAVANGVVEVLGEKLYQYDANLNKLGEPLGAYVDDAALGVTYADQRVRADGGCLAMTGRQFSPRLFTAALAPQTSFATPSPARAIAMQPGRLYVLTDHSLEIWSAAPLPSLPRPHAAR